MNFVINLLKLINLKTVVYNLILFIINNKKKIINHKLDKITINVVDLAKVTMNKIMRYYDLLHFIISNRNVLFTLKF